MRRIFQASSPQVKTKQVITKQTCTETLFVIRGKDKGRPAWHYILVPYDKRASLNDQRSGSSIDATKFGRVVEYRDERGKIEPASGWGNDPPEEFQKWIEDQYGIRLNRDAYIICSVRNY
ncbi:unnamed protein product [Rotaria sp. Silwood1]|nr:unnamed protein product [Rotaria sp. Silwood1]